jgi:hypothetical protein
MTRDRDSTHVDTVGEISSMVAANLDLLPEPAWDCRDGGRRTDATGYP